MSNSFFNLHTFEKTGHFPLDKCAHWFTRWTSLHSEKLNHHAQFECSRLLNEKATWYVVVRLIQIFLELEGFNTRIFSSPVISGLSLMPGLHSHWDNMRREREGEGYICHVCHVLDQFLSCLDALKNMLVNQSRVKGNENVSSASSRNQRYCDYILGQFLNIDYGLKFSEKCERMKLS